MREELLASLGLPGLMLGARADPTRVAPGVLDHLSQLNIYLCRIALTLADTMPVENVKLK